MLRFANFYKWFIKEFSCIAILFISIIKTTSNTKSTTRFKKPKNNIDGNSIVGNNKIINQKSPIKGKNQSKIAKS